MKQHFFLLATVFTALVSFSGCLDLTNDKATQNYLREQEIKRQKAVEQYRIDSTLIRNHVGDYGDVQIDTLSGIFYFIERPGNAVHPTQRAYITVNYKGKLLDGTVFDQSKQGLPSELLLSELIMGWQIGLQKIGSGGKITLYLPSYYGYGASSNEIIPANSVLIFEIELLMFTYQ